MTSVFDRRGVYSIFISILTVAKYLMIRTSRLPRTKLLQNPMWVLVMHVIFAMCGSVGVS
jgi:phosphatidylserine synthase